MTHMILNGMENRKKGLVIFLSSGSSTQPMPMQAAYASGKKLLDVLALNLSKEYTNVKFQSGKSWSNKKNVLCFSWRSSIIKICKSNHITLQQKWHRKKSTGKNIVSWFQELFDRLSFFKHPWTIKCKRKVSWTKYKDLQNTLDKHLDRLTMLIIFRHGIYSWVCLRQVGGIDYLNKMSTYHLVCENRGFT